MCCGRTARLSLGNPLTEPGTGAEIDGAATLCAMTAASLVARISLAGLVLVAACGGNSASPSSKSWAERICSDTISLSAAGDAAASAVAKAELATSVAGASAAMKKPLATLKSAVAAIDATWSDPKVPGTAMEPVRNALGKQLGQVYGVSDQIDSINETVKTADSAAAIAGPLADLEQSVLGARSGTAALKTAIISYKTSKLKGVAPAFSSGPECKKIK